MASEHQNHLLPSEADPVKMGPRLCLAFLHVQVSLFGQHKIICQQLSSAKGTGEDLPARVSLSFGQQTAPVTMLGNDPSEASQRRQRMK